MKESGEMYLESILMLSKERAVVRSVDVAEHMGYSKPSVSRALGLLREDGYIEVSPEGHLSLTEQGREKAESIFSRHTLLTELLIMIGVSEQTAAADACRIEHVISDETIAALRRHYDEMKKKKGSGIGRSLPPELL